MTFRNGVTWDVDLARRLYDQDLSYAAIGRECGTSKSAVMRRAKDYWPARPGDADRYAKHFLGRLHGKSDGKSLEPELVPRYGRGVPSLPPLRSLMDEP